MCGEHGSTPGSVLADGIVEEVPCDECHGTGKSAPDPAECPSCNNTRPAYDTCKDPYHDGGIGKSADVNENPESVDVGKGDVNKSAPEHCSICRGYAPFDTDHHTQPHR